MELEYLSLVTPPLRSAVGALRGCGRPLCRCDGRRLLA